MLTVKFDTDNAAFDDGDDTDAPELARSNYGAECARILRQIAQQLESDGPEGRWITLFDINGNDVGRWKAEP